MLSRTAPPHRILSDDLFSEPLWIALLVFVIAGAAILTALGFQHLGGYQPCALCLLERQPYYAAIPLAALAVLAAWRGASRRVLMALFALIALAMLYNAGLGVYHAGVEWRLWEGPASCSPSVGVRSAADMLDQLEHAHAPSCTDATWRFLGLSFAGWNAVVSAALCGLAALGFERARRGYGSSSASQ